jgi:hypothetical protein
LRQKFEPVVRGWERTVRAWRPAGVIAQRWWSGNDDERVDTAEVRVQGVSGRFEEGGVLVPADDEGPEQDGKDRHVGHHEDAFDAGAPALGSPTGTNWVSVSELINDSLIDTLPETHQHSPGATW